MPLDPKVSRFYRDQLQQLGNPPLGEWGRLAMRHWRDHLPDLAKSLGSELEAAAILAQEHAKEMFADLTENGMNPHAAQEIALAEYILLLPHDPPSPEDVDEGEANEQTALDLLLASPDARPRTRRAAAPPEPLVLNRLPLNQLCKEKLREAGEQPAPDCLYLLQLGLWGIDSGELEFNALALRYKLEQALGDLLLMPPKRALRTWYPTGSLREIQSDVDRLRQMRPVEVAQLLLEDLVLEADLM